MATYNPEEINPFRAPAATIGQPTLTGANADAEVIRRTYLTHEASIKSIGSLSYLGAILGVPLTILYTLMAVGVFPGMIPQGEGQPDPRLYMGISAVVMLISTLINAGMGYGLRNLQVWARWVTIVLSALTLLYFAVIVIGGGVVGGASIAGAIMLGLAIPALITGYIFYLVVGSKGAMVFSSEYREVIKQTPHIKYKTSLLIKIFLALIVGLIVLGIIAAIVGGIRS